jgi:hypothetical protein
MMRKIRRPNVRIIGLPNEWFTRSEDVLDTSIVGSYVYVEDRSNDSAGSKAGLIVGVVGKSNSTDSLKILIIAMLILFHRLLISWLIPRRIRTRITLHTKTTQFPSKELALPEIQHKHTIQTRET